MMPAIGPALHIIGRKGIGRGVISADNYSRKVLESIFDSCGQ